jgi:hypothetical protein
MRQPVDVPVLRGQADVLNRFHFQSGEGQPFGKLFRRKIEGDVFL